MKNFVTQILSKKNMHYEKGLRSFVGHRVLDDGQYFNIYKLTIVSRTTPWPGILNNVILCWVSGYGWINVRNLLHSSFSFDYSLIITST